MEQTPPQMGLMLKTLEMPQGMSGATWTGVEESLGRARVYGVDFWKQVFDAYNPFGPQSRYISVYDGFLECPKAGVYKFATMSDDGSFMLVDGELVAEWPGQGHNIDESRHGEKNGQRNLAAGRHAFRYVGLAFDGGRRMAAVWTPPGASAWQIIPPSAFPSVFAVPVLATDDSTRPVCAAFGMEEFQYLECGDARMVAVQFTSESGAQARRVDAVVLGVRRRADQPRARPGPRLHASGPLPGHAHRPRRGPEFGQLHAHHRGRAAPAGPGLQFRAAAAVLVLGPGLSGGQAGDEAVARLPLVPEGD